MQDPLQVLIDNTLLLLMENSLPLGIQNSMRARCPLLLLMENSPIDDPEFDKSLMTKKVVIVIGVCSL